MWTSPKYQTRIATDRQAEDHRAVAADRRADATIDRSNDDRPAAPTTTRLRLLSLPASRFLRA